MERSELQRSLELFFGFTGAELRKIQSYFELRFYKKGEYFLRLGSAVNEIGFLQDGITREFIELNGKEVTKWIGTKGHFISDVAGFNFRVPARWNIQAVTDVSLYVINRYNYMRIGDEVPSWNMLEKLFVTKCLISAEERIMQHLSLSAEERYHNLVTAHPEILTEVPLQQIASTLGIAPETLSRIRRRQLPR